VVCRHCPFQGEALTDCKTRQARVFGKCSRIDGGKRARLMTRPKSVTSRRGRMELKQVADASSIYCSTVPRETSAPPCLRFAGNHRQPVSVIGGSEEKLAGPSPIPVIGCRSWRVNSTALLYRPHYQSLHGRQLHRPPPSRNANTARRSLKESLHPRRSRVGTPPANPIVIPERSGKSSRSFGL